MRLQLILFLISTPGLLGQEISQSGTVSVRKGYTLSFTCTSEGSTLEDIVFQLDGQSVQRMEGGNFVDAIPIENGAAYTFGPVTEKDNGVRLNCHFLLQEKDSPEILLNVIFPPSITPPTTNKSVIEGTSFTTPLTITGNPFPVSSNIVITKDVVTVQDGRITVNIGSGNGASNFTIHNVTRTDSGSYTVNVTITAGSDTAVVNLDVYFLPVFGVVPPELQILNKSATFTFNCTPSEDGYPAVYVYVFQLNGSTISNGGNVEITGVSGSILTVSSLKRSEDSGNYTCMVTNEAGSVTIATYLNILAPASVPQGVAVRELNPFSATISWSPPSDNGGTNQPLKYSINITNNTVTLSFTTSDVTTLSLTNLQHSTLYTVTVVADNDLGLDPSPPAVINFTTPDSVPIIESVSVEALSLTILSVDAVLLTDGGQNVDNYTVLITSADYIVESVVTSDKLMSYNVKVDTLREGEFYNVSVTATNMIGPSETFQTSFTVNSKMSKSHPQGISPSTSTLITGIVGSFGGLVLGVLITAIIFICYIRCHYGLNNVPSSKSSSAPVNVVYEECEMKNVVELQHNPSYAVPSQVTGSTEKKETIKMADKGEDILTHEAAS